MTREEMKEIMSRIIKKLQEDRDPELPRPACIFGDVQPCDVCDVIVPLYAVEEDTPSRK